MSESTTGDGPRTGGPETFPAQTGGIPMPEFTLGQWSSSLLRSGETTGQIQESADRADEVAGQTARHASEIGQAWRSAGEQSLTPQAAPFLIVLAVGLALWLVGDRLFRPASSLVGAALGALVGLVAARMVEPDALVGAPTPYLAIGLGSLIGLGVGAAMYRLAVAAAGGAVLGLAGGALAVVLSLHTPVTNPDGAAQPGPAVATAPAEPARVEPVAFAEGLSAEAVSEAAASVGHTLRAQWEALPDRTRPLALACAILGCVVGLAAGLIRPRTIGPAAAALAGSVLWLGATTALLSVAGQPLPPTPGQAPVGWLAAWLGVALVGFAVQRRVVRPAALLERPAD